MADGDFVLRVVCSLDMGILGQSEAGRDPRQSDLVEGGS